ncbi:MAG: hypothetical protein L0I24_10635, partial [Pseudonocardia sp.]|nr:hypothetical protein [Pseudonocardia sp.]
GANAGMTGVELEGVDIEVGYTEVRAKVTLTAPSASEEQLKQLDDAVVPTSPVGACRLKTG